MPEEESHKTIAIRQPDDSSAADVTAIVRNDHTRARRTFVILRVVSGEDLFRVCAVHMNESVVVGRSKDCDLALTDTSVSRRHAKVTLEDDSVIVEDLGSSNGTTYREGKVKGRVRVEMGSEIVVGNIALKVERLGMEELTRLAQLRARAQDADVDPLSGVLTRRYLDEVLPVQLRAYTQAHVPVTVCFVDVDHFKTINDTRGHQAGDLVLRRIADLLRAHVRSSDDVVRYGGDEFLMVLAYCDEAAGLLLGERICRAIEALEWETDENGAGGEALDATVSVGVAEYGGDGIQRWLAAADKALYLAKDSGRNTARAASEASGGNAE